MLPRTATPRLLNLDDRSILIPLSVAPVCRSCKGSTSGETLIFWQRNAVRCGDCADLGQLVGQITDTPGGPVVVWGVRA